MKMSATPLVPDQIIKCISTGREPTVQELFQVAERIWIDGAIGRSAFSWGRLPSGSHDRLVALRGAQLALSGNRDPAYNDAARESIMGEDAGKDPDLRLPPRNADWSADVTTRSGYAFHLRRASHMDEAGLSEFTGRFDPDGLQARVLPAAKDAEGQQEGAAPDGENCRTEQYLAIEPDTDRIIATGLMCIDQSLSCVRAALVIRPDYRSGGIRWRLLEHIAQSVADSGVHTFEAIESREGQEPADLDPRPGWTAGAYEGDPTLIVWRRSLDRL